MKEKLALVTGASRGIGRAIAERLARDGFWVVGTATTDQGAEAIRDYLAAQGLEGTGQTLDVTVPGAIEAFMEALSESHGTPSVLVNNAGITRDNLLMRMKDEEWEAILATNLTSVFKLSRACMRGMMKARQGRIVTITSIVGVTGNAGQCNYSAAKAALIGFSKSLAKEVGSRGITVNCVAPGFIDTDMTRALSEAQRDALRANIPLDRLGEPKDIAAAVGFLCSPESAYITGETLHVNGGMYMA